jgi:hypothetical protein
MHSSAADRLSGAELYSQGESAVPLSHGWTFRSIAIAVCALLCFPACRALTTMTLERQATLQLEVVPILDQSRSLRVRISGLSGHSAMSVYDAKVRRSGDALDVLVRLELARGPDSRGDFKLDVEVPEDINVIRFGTSREEIWHR